jgi:antitoxin ParD1/3/4
MQMNVSLTPELETLVNEKVKSGNYNSASEVVREALRLLKEQDQLKQLRREELRKEIQKGADDMKAGRFTRVSSEQEADQLMNGIIEKGRKNLGKKK